ncbi:transporter [Stenotrophomonas sp. PFBMAA-4]|uniref:transporter n=1 Tax=Stenotrophomonas sp. PFBMAA-4 TaxID=3043301 RepID=UPI0024B4B9B4|nr:transporter [Stenotrophomonas sp. PFBMAA-4]MDI9271824.1 transporter [Stenotrophomonas sp. PFBMAA-4]
MNKALCLAAVLMCSWNAHAQEGTEDADALAKALANPVAALISVPFQYNYDRTFGEDGDRHLLNIQPVIPFSLNENWNIISRTIIPLTYQDDVVPGSDQAGLGDVVQSIFISPKEPTAGGLVWGVGPVVMLPTGTDDLSADTWAAGPTGVALVQRGRWTYGALVNHLVDVAGHGTRRADISSTMLQPFVTRGLSGGRTVAVNLESTYDWKARRWLVPINLQYSKVVKIGTQQVSLQGGLRSYLEGPSGGPDWGLRFNVTLLYPK